GPDADRAVVAENVRPVTRGGHPTLMDLPRAHPAFPREDVLGESREAGEGRAAEQRVEVLVREVARCGDVLTPALGDPAELVVPGDRAETVRCSCAVHLGEEVPGKGVGASERERSTARPGLERRARGKRDDDGDDGEGSGSATGLVN